MGYKWDDQGILEKRKEKSRQKLHSFIYSIDIDIDT